MSSPNILFLMTDQMQARVLEPDNPCPPASLGSRSRGYRPHKSARSVLL